MMAECQEQITVNDLVVQAGIHLRDLDMKFRDEHLLCFENLCDRWELVGRHLGLSQTQISDIKKEYNSEEMRRIRVLEKWKESFLNCTYRKLIETFLRCNMTQQALNACKALKQYNSAGIACTTDARDRYHNQETPQVCAAIDHNVDVIHRNVRESLRKLDRQFSRVQRQLMNSPDVTLSELKSCVATLASFSAEVSGDSELLSSKSKGEFFHRLKKYCSAQCPDILEDLIEELGDAQVKTKFGEFQQIRREFQRNTKLKDLVGIYEGPETVPSNYKELKIKLGDKWHEKTLEDLEKLCLHMSLKAWVLKLIGEGSLIVTCFVHECVSLTLRDSVAMKDTISYLCKQDVLQITLDQKCIFKQEGSANLASSLAAGVRYPVQASDDSQTDSPVRPKKSTAPAPTPSSTSQPSSTPPTERDFGYRQRLKKFTSSTSDKSNPDPADQSPMERRTSDDPISSPQTPPSAATAGAISPQSTSNVCSSDREAFEVGDCIQVDRPDSAPWYGVIKWIGTLPGSNAPSAGIEMEYQVEGGGCGLFLGTSYFSCSDGHGVFLPMSRLKRDNRFKEGTLTDSSATTQKETISQPVRPPQPGRSASDPMSNLSGFLSNLQKQLGLQDSTGAEKTASAPSESDEAGGPKCLQLTIPADRAGLVIGTGGKNIREVERLTNTSIKVSGSSFLYGGENRKVMIIGSEENCKKALFLIMKNVQRRVNEHTAGAKTISIPENCVGKVIGKGGATISTIKSLSGAHDIKIDDRKTGLEAMLQTERQCHIHGSEEAIEKAEELIRLAIAGRDIVGGATFAAIFVELMKMGIECQEESS